MANTLAPYGFRLWERRTGGFGGTPLAPGIAGSNIGPSPGGPLQFPSTAVLAVGDPVRSSLGIGYIAAGTNAVYGVLNSPVPAGFGDTATQKHYPEIIPADDGSVFSCQSTTTTNVTQALIGVAAKKYRIAGTTSGYTGIDFTHTTTGVLQVLALKPGSSFGTYAEVLVMIVRGAFFGQA